MITIKAALSILGGTIGLILLINVVYLFVFSVAGILNRKRVQSVASGFKSILVLFPVYKSDEVIIDSVSKFMKQLYPSFSYSVYVIADSLKPETLKTLRSSGANVVEVFVGANRNKSIAINAALSVIEKNYDYCLIMDADNVTNGDYLLKLNNYLVDGVDVVQTKRVAKNTNTGVAVLDSFSEAINNHIFRKGHRSLGLSASLIGSGMIFKFDLFKEIMNGINVFSGFDKQLELSLLERNVIIHYAEDVEVYDEKVDTHKAMLSQKRRWIFAQYYFFFKNWLKAIKLLLRGNIDFANKVFQFFLLPRAFTISLTLLTSAVLLIYKYEWHFLVWTAIAMLMIAIIIPVRENLISKKGFIAFLNFIPAFLVMLYATLTSRKAAGKFIHTPHKITAE